MRKTLIKYKCQTCGQYDYFNIVMKDANYRKHGYGYFQEKHISLQCPKCETLQKEAII